MGLDTLARDLLPPAALRLAKRLLVRPRYWRQARRCRQGFAAHGGHYPHPILFVAGLPKSGTTWLERMLASYPGYHALLIPDATAYELRHGGSHDYDLPADLFDRFRQMLVLTKMHVHGSPHNVALLRQHQIPHVVLFRDLRDVAVSYTFYVRQTPWHPHYPSYRHLTVQEGLARFADDLLADYVAWVRSWEQNGDAALSLLIRYEELLADTVGTLGRVAAHLGLDAGNDTVRRIVAAHQFQRLRAAERVADQGFFRKGVAGDWKNHFTPALVARYEAAAGDFLAAHALDPADAGDPAP